MTEKYPAPLIDDLDEVDKKILRILQHNSNITTKHLAAKVNLSSSPVFERVKKLEQLGVIKKYIAVLDAEKLDKGLIVFCSVTLKEHTKHIGNKFVKDIQLLPEITECYNISGDYDFLLKVRVKNMRDYQEFVLNRLGIIANIGSAHSTFVIGEIKNTHSVHF
ncbi:Transcription regulator, AsnC family [Tenacibaculum maritimum]|uniref:Leucine-responsive regulatory protein n=1 Tax=Tenacibaculum maritimum NCIMB 2154 TaxID=1349785 RepID=A0A2H1EB30_9FLAO|nr:Lrp/AsnC family transcriptional regulator [Tenacibaculum maritimum]SFZ83752.1 Leucine-responsive regulatory protein [Tenacibaculum maritimum NCIMB 2154]CAA0143613.1 Transcription regulator, AsnC family [Tenacibaculum maritimum]CAA0143941.1 Transcription regulator, AsnC family [Tenacibaculum maritimum]CAA0144549.1 Transcription regulator, AsnC family [Tenacibaculum maritimum]CAA0145239.1 Transcription regulator, AsnC family [Tenacibaculum maritimum]